MRKYFYFFKMRFQAGVQYRTATLTALTTQVIWGLMECLAYKVITDAYGGNQLPMDYSSVVSYIWLKEAMLVLFSTWAMDGDIFGMIMDGSIAYEMVRPISLYSMWFSKIMAGRLSQVVLRCVPVLLIGFLVPKPYRLGLPVSVTAFLLFLITTVLALLITIAFCTLVYMLCVFTISPTGWRMILTGAVDFLTGNILPLPFFPAPVRHIIEWMPFAYMQNVPFRIYSGDMVGEEITFSIIKQIMWIIILVVTGEFVWKRVEKRVVVQGG